MTLRKKAATLLMVITGVLIGFLISAQAVTYYYDNQNRLVEIYYDDETWMEYTYDDNGNLIAKTYHNNDVFTITATWGTGGSISPGTANVVNGGSRTFTITPDAHYNIAEVDIDGVPLPTPVSSYSFTDVRQEHQIHAKFSPYTYQITASVNGSGGTISPGTTPVDYGGSQTFTITPGTGFCIANVAVDGSSVGTGDTYTFQNVTGPHSITASFQLCSYSISVNFSGTGTVSPSSAMVTYGGGQTFTITPGTGMSILDVRVDGVSQGQPSTCTFVDVIENHTLSVDFGPSSAPVKIARTETLYNTLQEAYNAAAHNDTIMIRSVFVSGSFIAGRDISVTIYGGYDSTFNSNTGLTTIQAAPRITNGHVTWERCIIGTALSITASAGPGGLISPSGTVAVNPGAGEVAFTITPNTGCHVVDVLVDGVSQGGVTSYAFNNVMGDHTISASFSTTYSITASAGATGSIWPTGTVSVNAGGDETFVISPNYGYTVADVLVDGTSQGPMESFTFNNVCANHSISATFVPCYIITATAGTGGGISPVGAVMANSGSSHTFTITPHAGFGVSDVIVDGTSVGAVTSYTFSNVAADHTISASFKVVFTISATAGAGGSISPSGAVILDPGGNQTFNITANSGFAISSVLVDGSNVGAVTSYTFSNVTANHTISASFIPTYTITATGGTGGTISPSGTVTVNSGANQAFNITANEGYVIHNVIVDGSNVGVTTSYTFSNVTANHTISATFEVDYPVRNARTGVGYTSLQAAYNEASDVQTDTILSQNVRLTENFTAGRSISVIIDGGYDPYYGSNPNKTTIVGAAVINRGKVTLKNYRVSK
jgi:YD repeat-containing protein